MELEHRALWAVKTLNFDLKAVGENMLFDLNELVELRMHAYEKSKFIRRRQRCGMISELSKGNLKWVTKCLFTIQC